MFLKVKEGVLNVKDLWSRIREVKGKGLRYVRPVSLVKGMRYHLLCMCYSNHGDQLVPEGTLEENGVQFKFEVYDRISLH